eukprot:s2471_g3.t1
MFLITPQCFARNSRCGVASPGIWGRQGRFDCLEVGNGWNSHLWMGKAGFQQIVLSTKFRPACLSIVVTVQLTMNCDHCIPESFALCHDQWKAFHWVAEGLPNRKLYRKKDGKGCHWRFR